MSTKANSKNFDFFFASIGTILGSLYFIIGNYSVLVAGLVCLILSSTCFTGLSHKKSEILSLLTAFLIVFFNFNIRSEFIEYQDLNKKINQNTKFKIISNPKDYFFRSNIIIEKINEKNFSDKILSLLLPVRILAHSDSSKALAKGDIVTIEKKPVIRKIPKEKINYYKKDKVFYELKKPDVVFVKTTKNFITKLQRKIKNYYYSTLNEKNAGIVTSLLMGSRVSNIDHDFISTMRALGLGHFFAASGFHLLVLTMVLAWILKSLRLSLATKNSIISIGSIIYAGIAGFSPSIVRALIFVISFLALQVLKRKVWSLKFLIYFAGIILLIDPYTIYDIGFQLSYLATFSLILWYEKIQNRLDHTKIPSYFKDIISVTLSVQILLLPIIIYYFNSMQVMSIVANVIFTPLLSLIILLSFFGLSFLLSPLLNFLVFITKNINNLPYINSHIEIDITTMVLLFILLNSAAAFLTNIDWQEKVKFNLNSDLDEKFKQLLIAFSKNKAILLSLILSAIILLTAQNLDPIDSKKLIIEKGQIVNKKIPELHDKKDYQYFDLYGKKALILNQRSSLEKMNKFLNNIIEVHILFLPNLSSQDIYMGRIIRLLKPQFIITNFKEKNQSKKIKKNIELIGRESNIIVNSGLIYISKDKFWSIKK